MTTLLADEGEHVTTGWEPDLDARWSRWQPFADQPAVLIASDDGQPVYARLGYHRLERWTVWLREG